MNAVPESPPRKRRLVAALPVLGLWAFAIAQPAFDLLGRYPEVLIAHRAGPADVVLVALIVALLSPLPLMLLVVGAHAMSSRLGRGTESALLALLCALVVFPHAGEGTAVAGTIAAAAGAAAAWMWSRVPGVRALLVASSLAAPAFLAVFLLQPSISKLLGSEDGGAPATSQAAAPIPVTLIVYDALPLSTLLDEAGDLDAASYPNFARLAREGIWFKNATTSADFTTRAVPSMLTGLYPNHERHPTLADHPDNLFTLLRSSHELVASEAQSQLCRAEWNRLGGASEFSTRDFLSDLGIVMLHFGVPTELADRLPDIGEGWKDFGSPMDDDEASPVYTPIREHGRFVEAVSASPRPRFYFEHIVFPHGPYRYYPSGKQYGDGQQPGGKRGARYRRVEDEWAALHSYQRHILQTGYTDTLLGEVLERLEQAGQYDDGLIIVVADHGISYRPGEYFRHVRRENMEDLMPVPLLVKLPGGERAGTVSMRNVETMDIAPTVADVLGIELPWAVDGQSMLETDRAARPEKRCLGRPATSNQTVFPPDFIAKQMETVALKIRHFGTGSDPEAVFRLGDEHGLYGRNLDELEIIGGAAPGVSLHSPAAPVVDRNDAHLPLEILGYAEGSERQLASLRLAVAVNGRIAALTRPYRRWEDSEVAVWAAWISESSLRDGENRVEVFTIDTSEGRPRLRRTGGGSEAPSFLGVALARVPRVGVEEEGLGRQTGQVLRWSEGYTKLVVPLRSDDRPVAVHLAVAMVGKGGSQVELKVDGMSLFDGFLEKGNWQQGFPVSGRQGEAMVIEILSDGHLRRERETGEPQPHHSSIAIGGVWVLGEEQLR